MLIFIFIEIYLMMVIAKEIYFDDGDKYLTEDEIVVINICQLREMGAIWVEIHSLFSFLLKMC